MLWFSNSAADKPKATLKAETRIIPAGGSVTLTCSVEGSTGWTFFWYKYGKYYPVVGSSRNTEPDGVIRVSEGGKYSCRGKRGDPVFESESSEEVTIQETGEFNYQVVIITTLDLWNSKLFPSFSGNVIIKIE